MQETTNYKLKKLELTDSPADITVLNENWDKLDTEVKEHDSSLISHAQSITEINEELDSINTELDTKYDKAGGTISGAVSIASGGLDVTGDSTFNDDLNVKGMTVHEGTIRSTKANFLETKVNVSRGTPPSSTLYSYWSVFSKDGYAEAQKQSRLAHIDYSISNTGISSLGLYVNKYIADNKEVPVGLFARWTGETPQVMLTHTPPANSNDKSIATTDWVRALRATASEYGLIKLADESDLLSEADEAALTVSGAYKLSDFRRMSTAYALGDTVNCAFKSEYFLECTKAGTTSGGNLDTRNVSFGQVLTDGTCQWTVRRHLKSINGQAPDEDGNISVDVDTDNLAKLNAPNVFTQTQDIQNATPTLRLRQTKVLKGSNPSSNAYSYLAVKDNTGGNEEADDLTKIQSLISTSGDSSVKLLAYKNENGSIAHADLGVIYPKNGTPYATAPTPANTASSKEIITAEWANNNLTPKVVNTPVNDTDAANKSYVDDQISPRAVPTGTIIDFLGEDVPNGYLLCNGAAISRTTYANLFALWGTKFGSGDGSTTFNLPNLTDGRFTEGSTAYGTLKSAGAPSGTFQVRPFYTRDNNYDNSKTSMKTYSYEFSSSYSSWAYIATNPDGHSDHNDPMGYFRMSMSGSIQPKSITVLKCVKF